MSSEPPDRQDPPDDELESSESSGDSQLVVEPPVGAEDTRPLKPLVPRQERRPIPGDVFPRRSRRGRTPPATVLQETTAKDVDISYEPPPPAGETDKVRLVPPSQEPQAWRIILVMEHPSQTRFGLNVWQSLVIGRVDAAAERQPDLDLSPHRAVEQGVSRLHAVLLPEVDGLYIEDLGSTNGTWINGQFLDAARRHALVTGDRIELGLLRLVVRSVGPLGRASGQE